MVPVKLREDAVALVAGRCGPHHAAAGRSEVGGLGLFEQVSGQVAHPDRAALTDDEGVLEDVFELPYVAGIIMVEQALHGVFGKFRNGNPPCAAKAAQHMADQQRQVHLSVFQGRQFDPKDVEAVNRSSLNSFCLTSTESGRFVPI